VALTLALHLKMTQCYLIQKVGKRSSLSCQWQLFSFIFLWQKFVFVRIVSLPLVSIIQLLLFHLSAPLHYIFLGCRRSQDPHFLPNSQLSTPNSTPFLSFYHFTILPFYGSFEQEMLSTEIMRARL